MRILYVSNSGAFGGVEKHIKDLTQGMTQKGHEVLIWCLGGPMVNVYEAAGAKVTPVSPRFEIDPAYVLKLKTFLLEQKIDVVHVHDKSGGNALLAAYLAKTPVRVSNVHTPLSQWKINPIKKAINLVAYFFVTRLLSKQEIAITKEVKRVKTTEGIPANKITIIPNYAELPTNPSQTKRTQFLQKWGFEGKLVLGVVGRTSAEKGQDLLIKAFYKLSQEFDHIRLAIIGGGPLQETYQTMLNDLELTNKSIITGVFLDEDKSTLFSTLNVCVFPSRAEGFGYVPLEALALEIPVIASDLPVLKEVLGNHAMFFETGNIESLQEQLRYAITNYNELKSQQTDTSWINQKYGFDKFINSYIELYEELARK